MAFMLACRPFLAPIASTLLVIGTWTDWQLFHTLVTDPDDYHAAARAAAEKMPRTVGDWSVTRIDLSEAAPKGETPNLLEAREYNREATGERATLTIVQCRDAMHLQGYWPPVWYPVRGWTLRNTSSRTAWVGGLEIPVTVYDFTLVASDHSTELVVYNFLMRPGGRIVSGRRGVHEAEDVRMKKFGAGQLQVAFGPSVPAERRDEVFAAVVGSARPVLDALTCEVGR